MHKYLGVRRENDGNSTCPDEKIMGLTFTTGLKKKLKLIKKVLYNLRYCWKPVIYNGKQFLRATTRSSSQKVAILSKKVSTDLYWYEKDNVKQNIVKTRGKRVGGHIGFLYDRQIKQNKGSKLN